MLAATLGQASVATLLIVGAGGTANEIRIAGALEPNWRFVAVDPSPPMLELAMARVAAAGLMDRTASVLGAEGDLPSGATYDAATLIGVLHHLPGDAAKLGILRDIAARPKPSAPLILACNHLAYAAQPALLAAWGEPWRMQGATPEEVKAKLGKIM